MSYHNIEVSQRDNVRTVTINRPAKLNALNIETIAELSAALKDADHDPGTRVVILTGAGDKAFAAGADVSEFAGFSKEKGRELSATGHRDLFDMIPGMSKPVIAAINGYALGGGLELAMSCHIRIASTNALMGLPETGLGVIPGYGGTQRLPKLVGKGLAFEMILSAKKIDSEEALRIGLINRVTEPAGLTEACMELARRIAVNSPAAVAAAIRAINSDDDNAKSGPDAEIEAFASCFDSHDFKEGTTAFLEKRKPDFTVEQL